MITPKFNKQNAQIQNLQCWTNDAWSFNLLVFSNQIKKRNAKIPELERRMKLEFEMQLEPISSFFEI